MGVDRRNLAGRRALAGLVAVCGLLAATRVRAAQVDDDIDDPKVARRLGSRIDWPLAPGPTSAAAPIPTAASPVAAPSGPAGPTAATTAPAAAMPLAAGTTSAATTPPAAAMPFAASTTSAAASVPAASPVSNGAAFEPVLPRAQLAFRHFDFVRIGASDSTGLAASEAFDTLSLDVYPVSSLVRLGLSTAYGWQAGMTSDGDYFATETASLGPQIDLGRVVPFAEGLAGVGYMRRFQFDHTIPTVFWQLGIDLGASVYFARVGFVSLAVGYLRPVNGFLRTTSFESIYTNTWSFKIGIGI